MSDHMKEAERLMRQYTTAVLEKNSEAIAFYHSALLAHIQRGAVPDGWQVVPKEPTPEMLAGGWGYWLNVTEPGKQRDTAAKEYAAMLAAAPAPDQFRDAAKMMAGPSAFLSGGARYKISNGTVRGLPRELNGRWVALVAADDDCHLAPAPAEVPMPETHARIVSEAEAALAEGAQG